MYYGFKTGLITTPSQLVLSKRCGTAKKCHILKTGFLIPSKYYCGENNIIVRTTLPGPRKLFDPADCCVRMHEDYSLQNTYTGVLAINHRISSQGIVEDNSHETMCTDYYQTLCWPAPALGILCGITVLRGPAASLSRADSASTSLRYSIFSTRTSPSMSW